MRFYIILVFLILSFLSSAQQHDNIWLFGYESFTNTDGFGGSVMDFSEDTLGVYYEYRDMNLSITNASICDSLGNLLFYTNGIYIANALHEPMENGEGLNPGEYADDHSYLGYRLTQGAIVLPVPDNTDLYYLIHEPLEYPSINLDLHSPLLYYSIIDMSLNNGLGAVVEKNQIIFEDILDHGKITAVKHANGRDWWVLTLTYDSNCYRSILITPGGIENHGLKCMGEEIIGGLGQAVFSPDGSKYALYNLVNINTGNHLAIYDFDRCTGELSNPIQDILIDTSWAGGVAISPNSRYLYVSSYNYIYQYDLEADDVLSTKDTVAIYDGYEIILDTILNIALRTRFFITQLGPDGKIYINCPGGPNVLHVINHPDSAGLACEVLQHHIQLPTYNNSSLPNFPNYRLGALEGSACDSITSIKSPPSKEAHISLFPNPASDQINLTFEDILHMDMDFIIYAVTGQEVAKYKMPEGLREYTFDISLLNSGIYFYEIRLQGEASISGKITVLK
jgi:hypothetical protein